MKQYKLSNLISVVIVILLYFISLCLCVKVKLQSKGTYDRIIATPPPLDYNNFYQQNGINYFENNNIHIPQQNLYQQGIDPNQFQFPEESFKAKQYLPEAKQFLPEPNKFESNSGIYNQIPIKQDNSSQDFFELIRNAQNNPNPGEQNVLNNQQGSYNNYMKQFNLRDYSNVAESKMDNNNLNNFPQMFNPETNSYFDNQFNNNKLDYNNLIGNFNNTQQVGNFPLIDSPFDKNLNQADLSAYYKYFKNDNSNKEIISKADSFKPNTTVSIEQNIKLNQEPILNVTNNLDKRTDDKINYPRFKTSNTIKTGLSLENIFSGIDEDEKDKLVDQIKKKNKERKANLRLQLENCQNECKKTCERVKKFKKLESIEVCSLKCNLACSNNILNKLL